MPLPVVASNMNRQRFEEEDILTLVFLFSWPGLFIHIVVKDTPPVGLHCELDMYSRPYMRQRSSAS